MIVNTLEIPEKLLDCFEFTHGKENVNAYTGLVAYYAVSLAAEHKRDGKLLQRCIDYLGQYPDNFNHPTYNFEAYRVGGNAKAFLFLKGYFQEQKSLLQEYAEKTCHAEMDAAGLLCMPAGNYRAALVV